MSNTSRRYDEEFRRQAVELARSSKRPRYRIADELGISDGALAYWMKKEQDERPEEPLTTGERAELERLREMNRELLIERDILKKATAFWVKESNG